QSWNSVGDIHSRRWEMVPYMEFEALVKAAFAPVRLKRAAPAPTAATAPAPRTNKFLEDSSRLCICF
ncbi:MAG: hypothetical protein IJS84_00670, partial [Spirochaetales bacterium]|nr:hypothetical protein [Spirochaetales bacterium]